MHVFMCHDKVFKAALISDNMQAVIFLLRKKKKIRDELG